MRRKCKDATPKDATHYGKAFEASCKLSEAKTRLAEDDLSSATRKQLNKTVREETAKLESLTERDRAMTRLLAAFLRRNKPQLDAEGEIKRWLRGETDDLGTYAEFLDWCGDERIRLDEAEQRRPLSATEARFVSDLDEMDELDKRTIQYRLQNQYSARGKRGRPRKNTSDT